MHNPLCIKVPGLDYIYYPNKVLDFRCMLISYNLTVVKQIHWRVLRGGIKDFTAHFPHRLPNPCSQAIAMATNKEAFGLRLWVGAFTPSLENEERSNYGLPVWLFCYLFCVLKSIGCFRFQVDPLVCWDAHPSCCWSSTSKFFGNSTFNSLLL